jgi:DNA-binding cell septation regulator SpoVG
MFSYEVKVFPLKNPKGSLKAFGSLVIEDQIEVKGFRIMDGQYGLWVAVPQKEGKPDEQGKRTWWPDVIFLEEKEEDQKFGALQHSINQAFIAKFESVSRSSSRGNAASANASTNQPHNYNEGDPDIPW